MAMGDDLGAVARLIRMPRGYSLSHDPAQDRMVISRVIEHRDGDFSDEEVAWSSEQAIVTDPTGGPNSLVTWVNRVLGARGKRAYNRPPWSSGLSPCLSACPPRSARSAAAPAGGGPRSSSAWRCPVSAAVSEIVRADARDLPFPSRHFDLILTSPPWDNLRVVDEAQAELCRVLTRQGVIAMVLPNLRHPQLATLVVTGRDWKRSKSYGIPKPLTPGDGPYFTPDPIWAAKLAFRFRAHRRMLDPFAGSGTYVRACESVGIAECVGSDIEA